MSSTASLRRRRLLIVITIAVAAIAATVGYGTFRPVLRLHAVIADIKARGGEVFYQHPPHPPNSFAWHLRNVPWINDLLIAGDYFTYVELPKDCSVADLEMLEALPDFQNIHISSNELTDTDLRRLPPLTEVRGFDLVGDRFTAAGVKSALQKVPKADAFLILGANITDDVVDVVLQRKQIKFLDLTSTLVGDRGARAILTGETIQYVGLAKCPVTDACFKGLNPQDIQVSSLDVSDTGITDEGVAFLLRCPSVRTLKINGLVAGRSAIEALKANTWLETLFAERLTTDVSQFVVAAYDQPKMQVLSLDGSPLDIEDVTQFFCRTKRRDELFVISVKNCGVSREMNEDAEMRCWTELEIPPHEGVHFEGVMP